MLMLGQQPVSGTNLCEAAVALEAERGIVIDLSALQFPILPGKIRLASFITPGN